MKYTKKDIQFLAKAIEKSKKAVREGGFPVGAIIVKDDKIISYGLSNGKKKHDATSHAEINAIRTASKKLKTRNLYCTTLYSSMEPCLMCFSASYWAYIPRVVYACRKQVLKKMHFEGSHELKTIAKFNNRKIDLIHIPVLEKEALEVIKNWEKTIKKH